MRRIEQLPASAHDAALHWLHYVRFGWHGCWHGCWYSCWHGCWHGCWAAYHGYPYYGYTYHGYALHGCLYYGDTYYGDTYYGRWALWKELQCDDSVSD